MTKTLNVKLKEAYDTEANWKTVDPVLLAGQLAFSSDKNGRYKIGDGIKNWMQLPYNTLDWSGISGKPSTFNPTAHNHTISQITDIKNASVKYATSSGSATNATTATKLGTVTKGSATQPVYLNAGVPTACTYTLGKSVPSNAVFTDTNTWIPLKGATSTDAGTAGYAPAPSAGAANRYLRSDGTWSVPPDTNTTYGVVSTTANGLAPKRDGSTAHFLRGDGKWATPPNTTYTLSSFGITATSTELNYCDGVTSNIQTQLNGKAKSSHTHTASQITGLPNVLAITNAQIDSLKSL